jgi:ribosomal protein S18 acetylase RimI-like enzyme
MNARPVASDRELEQILALQRANLAPNLTAEEIAAQGFVTVVHDLPLLQRMHAVSPSIVAVDGDQIAGYALVMPVECRDLIPVLVPMFDRLDALGIARYYIMGQICVAAPYRGRGVFDALYEAHRAHLGARYERCVTEVATRNTRSMRAHERVGFRVVETYRDETDEWALIAWDWR